MWGRILSKKNVRVSNIVFPVIFSLLGKISSGKKQKRTEISEKKIKVLKNGGGEEYQAVGNFMHPE